MMENKGIPEVALAKRFTRRRVLLALSVVPTMMMAAGPANSQTHAASWPTKAVHIVAAQAPGSSNDVTARALADYLGQKLGVSVVVENKAGGVSMVAAAHVARADPDGHTMLLALNSQLAQAPVILTNPPINPDTDLIPVASFGVGPVAGVVHKDFEPQNLEELVEYAKKTPVNVGNYAIGSGWQLMLGQLAKETGAQFNIINYKGTGAMVVDLYSGRLDIGAGSLAGLGSGIQAGNVNPIVVFTPQRSSRMPDVPTWVDAGYTGPAFEHLQESNVLYVPANTPPEVVERIASLALESYRESERMQNVFNTLAEESEPIIGEPLKEFIEKSWGSYRKLTVEQNKTGG